MYVNDFNFITTYATLQVRWKGIVKKRMHTGACIALHVTVGYNWERIMLTFDKENRFLSMFFLYFSCIVLTLPFMVDV